MNLGAQSKTSAIFTLFDITLRRNTSARETNYYISDLLTFNAPAGRRGSGDVYRHDAYDVMRQYVERVTL